MNEDLEYMLEAIAFLINEHKKQNLAGPSEIQMNPVQWRSIYEQLETNNKLKKHNATGENLFGVPVIKYYSIPLGEFYVK